jgi:DNA-binding LacI/PurR family transcriptional regulator/DNA-binding transcriptional regulator YhcF (GntR family)
MKRSGYKAIAAQLAKAISDDPAYAVPSLLEIAAANRVSYRTAWRAMQVLAKDKIIIARPGRTYVVSRGSSVGRSSAAMSAGDALYEDLKKKVLDGVYQAGRPFPKVAHFIIERHCSPLTIMHAFKRLEHERLAHSLKRRWYAGPAPARVLMSSRTRPSANTPVALVLTSQPEIWHTGFENPFVNSFLLSFRNDITAHAIQLQFALREKTANSPFAGPGGMDEVCACLRQLGRRYCGTLILSNFPREETIGEACAELCRFDKPVVYFDSIDEGTMLTRASLSGAKRFFRLHLDERNVARTALGALAGMGHRRIGIHGTEQYEWADRRARIIRQCAADEYPECLIFTAGPAEKDWGFTISPVMHHFVSTVAQKLRIDWPLDAGDVKAKDRLKQALIREGQSLVSLLTDCEPTALISPNDRMSWEHYFWLREVGVAVPGILSHISFDNAPSSIYFPISTIDFGFARLGYLAAHILIGDVPVHAGRDGGIAGTCTLIDRGSIGPSAPRIIGQRIFLRSQPSWRTGIQSHRRRA